MDEDEEMILFNHRVESEESGVVEEDKGTELEPLNPPVPTETANRATDSDEEPTGDVEVDVNRADIGYGGSTDGLIDGNVSVRLEISCFIIHMLTSGETLKSQRKVYNLCKKVPLFLTGCQ